MNPTDVPIACTLTSAEIPERMAEIASLGAQALTSAQLTGTRAVLRFRPAAQTRERLAVIVEAESKCCASLTMDLRSEDDALVLTIGGPESAEPVLRDLVGAFGITVEVAA